MAIEPKVTIAIDIGDAFCGYAYYIEDTNDANKSLTPDDIRLNRPWRSLRGYDHLKTPTALLYDDAGQLLEFGFRAFERHVTGPKRRYLYQHFKHSDADVQVHEGTEQIMEQQKPRKTKKELYSDIMTKLKEHCLDKIHEYDVLYLEANHITWVLCISTLTASIDEAFLREAALQGGLITDKEANNIDVIMESEAAYSFCRALDRRSAFKTNLSMEEIDCFLNSKSIQVVDIGGQATDISTSVSGGSTSRGACVPFEYRKLSGLNVGAEQIVSGFERMLRKIVGSAVVKAMQECHRSHWLLLMNEFRVQMNHCHPDYAPFVVLRDITMLERVFKDVNDGSKLSNLLDEKVHGMHIQENQWLCIKMNLIKNIVEESMSDLNDYLIHTIDESQVEVVFLTGGYAQSLFLEDTIQKVLGEHAKVVIPRDPQQAVLKGAVLHSWNLRKHDGQIPDANYGVITKRESQNQEHILKNGTKMIPNYAYEKVVRRDDLPNPTQLCIYRDQQSDFMEFDLSPLPFPAAETGVKVHLQIKAMNDLRAYSVLQVSVFDEANNDVYIRRVGIGRGFRAQPWISMMILLLGMLVVYWLFCLVLDDASLSDTAEHFHDEQ